MVSIKNSNFWTQSKHKLSSNIWIMPLYGHYATSVWPIRVEYRRFASKSTMWHLFGWSLQHMVGLFTPILNVESPSGVHFTNKAILVCGNATLKIFDFAKRLCRLLILFQRPFTTSTSHTNTIGSTLAKIQTKNWFHWGHILDASLSKPFFNPPGFEA